MKRFNIFLVVLLVIYACKEKDSQSQTAAEETIPKETQVFGASFDPEGSKSGTDMLLAFNDLSQSDSLDISFSGEVTDVCKMKGCWIKVALDGEQEIRVTFKDYGFFVPKDITGKQVTLRGKGFIEEMSVEDQRHFAEDGGATEEEIAKITEPKVTYSFVADGVLLND